MTKLSESTTGENLHVERKQLTHRQQAFVDAYAGEVREAAEKAGLSYAYARRLVTKSHIVEAIRNRQNAEVRPKTIATRQERQEFWTKTMTDEDLPMGIRLRASELLAKSEMDFGDNGTKVQVGLSIADIFARVQARGDEA